MSDESFRLTPQSKPSKSLNYQERVRAGLQRGGLRQVSKDKQKWLDLYKVAKEDDKEEQECFAHPALNKGKVFISDKFSLDPHHLKGREGNNILYYKYICRACHDWIHKHATKAREIRLLEM